MDGRLNYTKTYAFYLFSLNLESFGNEYCILAVELLYGALQISSGVEMVTDIRKIIANYSLFILIYPIEHAFISIKISSIVSYRNSITQNLNFIFHRFYL